MLKNKIRAAQIDLNRQKESLASIRNYIDFIAANGYNTLVLYIAWRVKIKSHPWPSEAEAYCADEIREMAGYARDKGLSVIPTTNLTYVTSLLKYDELKKFLEQGTRFWGGTRGNFCCSNPEVYEFIEAYLKEMAGLIPSDYFHIGGDETWDVGFCERCRGTDFSFEKEQGLYLNFILRVYSIVAGQLGRRMIMWDDMLEYYPGVLPKIPRDVILAHWQYQPDCYRSMGHFGNLRREQTCEKYDRMGFSYMIAPAPYRTSNGRTLTEANFAGKNLVGGIMTIWGSNLKFLFKDLPTIASIGRFWANDGGPDECACFKEACLSFLEKTDESLLAALRSWTENSSPGFPTLLSESNLLNFPMQGLDYAAAANRRMAAGILENGLLQTTTFPGRCILEEICLCMQLELAAFELKTVLQRVVYQRRFQAEKEELNRCLGVLGKLAAGYAEKWPLWRPGIEPDCISEEFAKIFCKLKKMVENVIKGDFIRILFCLPDGYGAVRTTVTLQDDAQRVIPVGQGVYKGAPIETCFYEVVFPLNGKVVPNTLRIEAQGYGGQGIAYAAADIAGVTYLPEKVAASGQVLYPQFVLDDDCKTCWLGEPDATKAWQNRTIAEDISTLEISLKAVKDTDQ